MLLLFGSFSGGKIHSWRENWLNVDEIVIVAKKKKEKKSWLYFAVLEEK